MLINKHLNCQANAHPTELIEASKYNDFTINWSSSCFQHPEDQGSNPVIVYLVENLALL